MNTHKLHCKTMVAIGDGDYSFGPGVARLLKGIERYGSLKKAAEAMHMSYSKAWTVIKNAESIWGFSLLHRHVGGAHGGSSSLTTAGKAVVAKYEELRQVVIATAEKEFNTLFCERELDALRQLSMEEDIE